ncbi:HD domain-containing phosphohydrolase [Aidingimonas lacisalsi]|uniref:HD domain-containing phosphohydrolase n=1 Tax=Aidingimonas lacisalsi TaxID=2604086 RepID=UPI0011D288D7|nr:HD domain-containing phosphohydrolase [Aidingimonas lacisalsi]
MESSETHRRIEHAGECQELLETLCEPGGAALIYEAPGSEPLPALLMALVAGEHLLIDITAIPEIADGLESGQTIRLVGRSQGAMLRTSPLQFRSWVDAPGRIQCLCEYPDHLEVIHRREVFRAELRAGMEAAATITNGDSVYEGALCNLSLGGCMVALPSSSAATLGDDEQVVVSLTLAFPNDQRLTLRTRIRHVQVDGQSHSARLGCQFIGLDSDQERRVWFYVREIERESARRTAQEPDLLAPSPLFETADRRHVSTRPHGAHYATPMARRLAHVSGFLSGQLLDVQAGRDLDSRGLSKQADQLLTLMEGDREGLLFACVCQTSEPALVQHGVSVAVRLADLARDAGMPRDTQKALVAASMVHDFGKALLPRELRQTLAEARELGDEEYRAMMAHVALIQERLAVCRWLDADVSASVVSGVNERLDGSGYPQGVTSAKLDELARMAAIVDVIDAMSRYRADRRAHGISDIYRYLLHHPERFDARWIQRYVHRFGVLPIGSLARFSSGQLAWIQRLDANGRPRQVQLTDAVRPPDSRLGDILRDDQLVTLGEIEGLEVVDAVMPDGESS